jgi:hypothetical protein
MFGFKQHAANVEEQVVMLVPRIRRQCHLGAQANVLNRIDPLDCAGSGGSPGDVKQSCIHGHNHGRGAGVGRLGVGPGLGADLWRGLGTPTCQRAPGTAATRRLEQGVAQVRQPMRSPHDASTSF